MPRKPKHRLTTRKGFWKQLKGPQDSQDKAVAGSPVEQPASPAVCALAKMVTTGTQMDLEFATVGIQVDIKPQMVDVSIQVSLEEEISDDHMLNVSLDTAQSDCNATTMESADVQLDKSLEQMGSSQNQTDHLYTSHDAKCDDYFKPAYNATDEEIDIQLEATQMDMIMNSTENACSRLDPSTPNRLIESVSLYEASEYSGESERLQMCKGNDEEFIPLVAKHKGVFKDTKGT